MGIRKAAVLRPLLLNRSVSTRLLHIVQSHRFSSLQSLQHQWEESTGQIELGKLKAKVFAASENFDNAVQTVSSARTAVEEAQKAQDEATKRHASLLMKREQWDASDASAFVESTSTEVSTRQELQNSREALRKAETDASRCQREYMDLMRQRYQEEQTFQEKWRMISTYWTWALIGLNSVVFLGSQVFHQRREANRLKSIEILITDKLKALQDTLHQTQAQPGAFTPPKTTSVVVQEKPKVLPVVVAKVVQTEAVETKLTEKNNTASNAEDAARSASPQVDWVKVVKEGDFDTAKAKLKGAGDNMEKFVKQLDGPSVAVGAIASTSVLMILTLLTSNRR